MRKVKAVEVIALAEDLLAELAKMQQLEWQIQRVQTWQQSSMVVFQPGVIGIDAY